MSILQLSRREPIVAPPSAAVLATAEVTRRYGEGDDEGQVEEQLERGRRASRLARVAAHHPTDRLHQPLRHGGESRKGPASGQTETPSVWARLAREEIPSLR